MRLFQEGWIRGFYSMLRFSLFNGQKMIGQGIGNIVFPEIFDLVFMIVMVGEGLDDGASAHACGYHSTAAVRFDFPSGNELGISTPGCSYFITALSIPVTVVMDQRSDNIGSCEYRAFCIPPVDQIQRGHSCWRTQYRTHW